MELSSLGSMNQTGNDYIYLGLITYNQPYNSFFIGKKLFLKQGGEYINKECLMKVLLLEFFKNTIRPIIKL